MNALRKLAASSTFWASIVLPAINLVSTALGYPIPWDIILAGVGGYAVKESAAKLAKPSSSTPA
jgi:hypothetical protein